MPIALRPLVSADEGAEGDSKCLLTLELSLFWHYNTFKYGLSNFYFYHFSFLLCFVTKEIYFFFNTRSASDDLLQETQQIFCITLPGSKEKITKVLSSSISPCSGFLNVHLHEH